MDEPKCAFFLFNREAGGQVGWAGSQSACFREAGWPSQGTTEGGCWPTEGVKSYLCICFNIRVLGLGGFGGRSGSAGGSWASRDALDARRPSLVARCSSLLARGRVPEALWDRLVPHFRQFWVVFRRFGVHFGSHLGNFYRPVSGSNFWMTFRACSP